MADFKIKLTTAGKTAMVDESNIGTDALKITSLELGSSFYNPTGNETNLTTLIKPLATFGGTPAANGIIHVSIRDESDDEYELGEIGLRTGTGILLGIVSSEEGLITTKGTNDILLVAADLAFTEGDISNITFGEASFIYQPGTEEKAGIFELATPEETDAGTPEKVIDAKEFKAGLDRRSSSSTELNDVNKLATSSAIFALAQLIESNNSAIQSINTILQSDETTIDTMQEVADIILAVKNTQDTLAIGNISGLQAALNNKVNSSRLLTDVPLNALFTDTNTWREISDSTFTNDSQISASSKAVKVAYEKASHSHAAYSPVDSELLKPIFNGPPVNPLNVANIISGKGEYVVLVEHSSKIYTAIMYVESTSSGKFIGGYGSGSFVQYTASTNDLTASEGAIAKILKR